jgi:hypothetical protein
VSEGKRRRRKTGHSKVTPAIVIEMRYRRARGEKLIVLAIDYQLSESTVSRICRGILWPEVELA